MSLLKPILRPALRSVLSSITSAIRRHFTTFDPVSQTYVQLSSAVNATQITMDVYSVSGDNTGLPTGAPALTAGQLETITFAYSGSISEIGRNGSSYFDGIIANVKIQDAGATVLDMPLDGSDYESNTTVVDKSPSGNNGTAINFAAADTELFTFNSASNAWVGSEELWTFGDVSSDGTEGAFTQLTPNYEILQTGRTYKVSTTATNLSAGELRIRVADDQIIATSDGFYSNLFAAGGVNARVRIGETQANAGASLTNISFKRAIPVA